MGLTPYSRTGKLKACSIRKFTRFQEDEEVVDTRDLALEDNGKVILFEAKKIRIPKEVQDVADDSVIYSDESLGLLS